MSQQLEAIEQAVGEMRQEERERWERVNITVREAALMMLMPQGCPQSLESLELLKNLKRIEVRMGEVREQLRSLGNPGL